MGLLSLKAASLMDWAAVDLILTLLFAAIITVNLFLLGRRLHHLERRKIFDLEDGRHDVELLNKFRDLQTIESKNAPFDERAFQCFMDLASGKNPSLDSKSEAQKTTLRHEDLLQAVVKFFHLERSEASVNEKQELGAAVAPPDYTATVLDETKSNEAGHVTDSNDFCCYYGGPSKPLFKLVREDDQLSQINSWGLHKCSGCSKQMTGHKFRETCVPWTCGRQWCDSCMDNIQRSISLLGGLAQAYCTSCGTVLACHGFDLLFPQEAVYFETMFRNVNCTSVQMASCVVAEKGEGTMDLFAYDIDLSSGQAHLSPIEPNKTSSKAIMDEQELAAIPNLNKLTSEEDSSQPSSKKLLPQLNAPVVPACWSEHQQSLYDSSTIDPALICGAGQELPVKGLSNSLCPPL